VRFLADLVLYFLLLVVLFFIFNNNNNDLVLLQKRENSRRRKSEDHHTGRKMKERKAKMAEPSLWGTNHPVQTDTRVPSFVSHNAIQNNQILTGATEIDRAMQQLLVQNDRLLDQIEANMLACQVGVYLSYKEWCFFVHRSSYSRLPGLLYCSDPGCQYCCTSDSFPLILINFGRHFFADPMKKK
jgi:hypothetical protein